MNEVKWVIQSNKIKISQVLPLVSPLREYNIPFIDVSVDTYQNSLKEIGDFVGDNFIPYGSTHLIKLASEAKWKHVWYDENNFNVKHLGEKHSNVKWRRGHYIIRNIM